MTSRKIGLFSGIFPLVMLTLVAGTILISAPAGSQVAPRAGSGNAPFAAATPAAGES